MTAPQDQTQVVQNGNCQEQGSCMRKDGFSKTPVGAAGRFVSRMRNEPAYRTRFLHTASVFWLFLTLVRIFRIAIDYKVLQSKDEFLLRTLVDIVK